jgi:uncharacterized Zn-finger protein
MKTQEIVAPVLEDDGSTKCTECGNSYIIEFVEESDDYNDFGQRYCPYCGHMTNVW